MCFYMLFQNKILSKILIPLRNFVSQDVSHRTL